MNSKQQSGSEKEALTAKAAVSLQEELADHHLSLRYGSLPFEALEWGPTVAR
jgi:hypothetical protein